MVDPYDRIADPYDRLAACVMINGSLLHGNMWLMKGHDL